MRGGDSLMFWISRLNGVIWNICHSSNFIRQPTVRCPSSVFFGNRFRSADCQKIQLPLGGSQGAENLRFCHSTNRSVPSASGGFYPPLRVCGVSLRKLASRVFKIASFRKWGGGEQNWGLQRQKISRRNFTSS